MFRTFFAISFAFLLQANAHADGVSGVMMVVKGSITIQSKSGKSTPAKVGAKVFPQDTIVAGPDSRAKIVMSDKNVINISPDTKMALEKYVYNPQSDQKNVLLNVVYGKVRSTVNQKYDGDKNTFQVKTASAVAGVRGTDFLASFNQSTQTSKVVTFSGMVEVGKPGPNGAILNTVKVAPGQFTTASPAKPPTPPAAVPKAELNSLNQESKVEANNKDSSSSNNKSASNSKSNDSKDENSKDTTSKDGGSKDAGNKDSGNKDSGNQAKNSSGGASGGPASSAPSDGSTTASNSSNGASTSSNSAGNGSGGASNLSGNSPSNTSTMDSAARAPSAVGPAPGSMLSSSDLGPAAAIGGANFNLAGSAAPAPANFSAISTPQAITAPPTCTFCNSTLTSTKSHLSIAVKVGP